jgi:hypothetical protein
MSAEFLSCDLQAFAFRSVLCLRLGLQINSHDKNFYFIFPNILEGISMVNDKVVPVYAMKAHWGVMV